MAQELAHPHSLVLARSWAAWVHQFCRRPEHILQEPTEAALAIATEQGLWFYWGILTIVRGWALASQGKTEAGLTQIDQGLSRYKANVGEHYEPYFLALLAEVQSTMGRSEDALQSLTNALAVAEKNGEHFYDAELYRLKEELLLLNDERGMMNDERGTDAIEVARRQQAKSLELRAATSLARLWHQQGKTAEAYELLTPVYNWFTEGFDIQDLQNAKALLADLA